MQQETRKLLDKKFSSLYPDARREIFLKILCSVASNSAYAELLPGAMVNVANDITEHFLAVIQESKYYRDGMNQTRRFPFSGSRLSFARRLRRTFFNLQLTLKTKCNEIPHLFQGQKNRERNL